MKKYRLKQFALMLLAAVFLFTAAPAAGSEEGMTGEELTGIEEVMEEELQGELPSEEDGGTFEPESLPEETEAETEEQEEETAPPAADPEEVTPEEEISGEGSEEETKAQNQPEETVLEEPAPEETSPEETVSLPAEPEADLSIQEETEAEKENLQGEDLPLQEETLKVTETKTPKSAPVETATTEAAKETKTTVKAAASKPGKVSLKSVSCTTDGLKISWKGVSGATGYYIYWWNPNKKKYVKFASTSSTSYVDTTAKAGTHYYYTVAAYNSAGTGDYDYDGISGIYLPPAKINSIKNADSGVKFSWNSVKGATGYRIYWRYKGGTKWKKWKDVTGTSVDKAGKKSGTTYEYLVWPYKVYKGKTYWADEKDSFGASIMYLSTPKLIKPKDASSGLKISWEKVQGAKEYRVYYWHKEKKKYVHFATTTSTSYVDTKAKAGVSYYYTVCAYNGDTCSDWDYGGIIGTYKYKSVLFIGNSLTVFYTANCPNIVKSLAGMNGQNTLVKYLTHGGATLYDFACGSYQAELASVLKARKYDVIVLQEESWTACSNQSKYLRNINYMMDMLNRYGQEDARIVLYAIQGCTHKAGTSYDTYEKNTLVNLTLAYERIKWHYGYDVVVGKAGELHMQVRNAYPSVNLMQDGNHPNYTGFYLSSMRLYNSIYDIPLKTAESGMRGYISLNDKAMSINYTWTELNAGESITLKCSGSGSGKVTWTSYNSSVATVSSSGVVKAVKAGKAVILAQSSTGLQQTCVVYVY